MCTECQNHVSEDRAEAPKNIAAALAPGNATYDDPATLKAPMREVPSAIMMQNDANDRLSKAVEILHERTTNLRHSGIERGEEDRAMRDFGSETARNIADQANRTDMAARVIEKILTEMEI